MPVSVQQPGRGHRGQRRMHAGRIGSPTRLSLDNLLRSGGNTRLPSRVLDRIDDQGNRLSPQNVWIDPDDLARPPGSHAGREPIGSPSVTGTVQLPRREAEESRSALGAELSPPRVTFRGGPLLAIDP